jgi:hypothetical protein
VVPNGGIDESASDHDLPPQKWAKAFDVEPLPTGCRVRSGKTKVNETPISGAPAITGVLDYRLSDGSTERILVAAGAEVYTEASGSMTLVSPGAGAFTVNADVHPAMTVGSDIAFISNGIETPAKFFVRSGTQYWASDGIAAPTATSTAVAAAGGTLTSGVWHVDYYYWDDLLGIKSNTRYQGVGGIAVSVNGTQKITISGLPAAVARVGDRVTHLRISLQNPSGGIFRFAGTAEGQIALGATTASITTDATTNEPDYDDDTSPVHSLATVGANQRFISGIAATPWRVMASKVNIVAPYYESFPSLNYRDFGRGDGDYVTALAFIPPATLIVGMRNSVWALDARRFLTSDPVLISKNVGIAGGQSFMVVGRALFFVSDSDRMKGMMLWDGSKVTPLLAIDKTFKTFSQTRIRYASCAHLAPGDNRFQWWTLFGSRMLVYDYALDAWTIYRHSGNVIASAAKAGAIAKVKIGGTDGFLYDADTGLTDSGTEIIGTFTAKRYDFGAADATKRVRFLRAEGGGSSYSHLDVQFEPDIQGFPSFSGRLDFSGAPGSLLGNGTLGSFILGSTDPVISTRVGLVGVCRNAQPSFTSSSTWNLRGYALGAQILRRRA